MKNSSMNVCLATVVLFMAADRGFGITYFKDGRSHDINYTVNAAWVDYQAPGMQTTVNLLEGGFIDYRFNAYNDGRITMSGGTVDGYLQTYNNSRAALSGGIVTGYLRTYDDSHVTMSGGVVNNYFLAYGNSYVTVSNGTVGIDLTANANSHVTLSGGTVNGNFYAYDTSTVTLSGGAVGHELIVSLNSHVDMSGGSADVLRAYANSQITISGGLVNHTIFAVDSVEIILKGSNFAIDGNPVGFGDIISSSGIDSYRQITGTLANGDIINNQFKLSDQAKIVIIPEPVTLLLLGLGGIMIRRKRHG